MSLEQTKKIINKNLPFIKEKYKVKEMGIFGSYATGKQKEKSDLDILVEFYEPITLLKYAGLKNFLEDKINFKVDLIHKSGLKPIIKNDILKEVIYIWQKEIPNFTSPTY